MAVLPQQEPPISRPDLSQAVLLTPSVSLAGTQEESPKLGATPADILTNSSPPEQELVSNRVHQSLKDKVFTRIRWL